MLQGGDEIVVDVAERIDLEQRGGDAAVDQPWQIVVDVGGIGAADAGKEDDRPARPQQNGAILPVPFAEPDDLAAVVDAPARIRSQPEAGSIRSFRSYRTPSRQRKAWRSKSPVIEYPTTSRGR